MKNGGTDRRVVKTRAALHAAMIRLLRTTKLENMTVTMLCAEANVSRSAFYDHYSVPEDCFNEIVEEKNDWIIDQAEKKNIRDFESFLELYFSSMAENKEIFRTLYSMDAQNTINQKIMHYYVDYLYQVYPNFPEYPELYMKYIQYGFIGIVSEWLGNDCQGDYKTYIDMQTHLFNMFRAAG